MPCESRPPAPNLPTVTDLGPLLFAARRSLACPEPSRRVANSFICHTSEIRARKSFNCHTSKNRACKSGSPSLSRSPKKKTTRFCIAFSAKSCVYHTYGFRIRKSFACHTSKNRACKSFACHTFFKKKCGLSVNCWHSLATRHFSLLHYFTPRSLTNVHSNQHHLPYPQRRQRIRPLPIPISGRSPLPHASPSPALVPLHLPRTRRIPAPRNPTPRQRTW